MTEPRKSRRVWVWACLGLLLASASGWGVWRFTRKPPDSVELRPRELKQTIVSSGQIMAPAEVRLDSMLTSTVKEIHKREGDVVKAGEVLITLDEREIDAARAQAEAVLAQAQAGKSSLKVTTLPEATEVLAQVRANLAEAKLELERQRKLFEAGVTTGSAREKAERAVTIYESQEKAALTQVQAASSRGSGNLSASATVALAEAQLAVMKVSKDRAKILAPMDGVISSRFVEVGEVVRPGSALLVLTARGRTRIVLEPDERNLALLAIGQKAAVSAEAFPSESFEARVGYIAPAVNGDRGTIEVRLDVPNPPANLRPNMTVSVELSIETRDHALAVPLTAVQDLGTAHPWVGVLGPRGGIEHREVRLGLKGDELVEILSGARAGERIVFDPPIAKSTNALRGAQ
ncbi:MAG: efflux RND transporter periplasmic adaptor subunit [Polyangiaceae bacterium]|nr:efflux RND transporter periplasmic adaptor subunit [Polyangiaceae bacterium]